MGILADAALAAGGEVLGVIPDFLMQREVMHKGITELVVTDSMHSRKQRMFEVGGCLRVAARRPRHAGRDD